MNYNEIVNRFKEIVQDHTMLQDFGYGQISDIKTRSEGGAEAEGVDYPYLFLNPGTHNRTQNSISYSFNMIIMDMAREEEAGEYQNFLNIQSDCIQYCDDVIARLYYYYKDQPEVSFSITYTPFYERFQDDLAGATATISIEVPTAINECIAPYERLLLNTFTNPNVNGTNDFHSAFRAGAEDKVNYPEYDWQFNEFEPYFSGEGEFDYKNRRSPLVINDNPNGQGEGLVPYFDSGSRRVIIPAGYNQPVRLDYDMELTNVQGLDLTGDRLWWQVVINGQEQTYMDVPPLPIDGTPVEFKESFYYTPTPGLVDDIVILFRYSDGGTPAPNGPTVGYRGGFKIYEV